ncbi:MAG TPA: mucoidy inhibitor MuiA family protein, partial [Myxococcota bacterium]|nr:mucoidy inhibitor MuiA family protein [Myxococcota bacterium]
TFVETEPRWRRNADEPRALSTRISAVTVYADRAQVTRTASVDLGVGRYAIAKLPGWLDGESVRATLTPASAGRILDVAVEKSFLVAASEEAVRVAEARVREVADEILGLTDEEKTIQAEVAQLEAIRAFSLDKLPRDMATRDIKVKTFAETLDYVSEALRKNKRLIREVQKKKRALEPELAARQREQNELRAKSQLEESTIVVELKGEGRATLTITYLTPGATWEPVGELRVTDGGKAVSLVQFASIVQTTGEDWEGAELSFATQRPDQTLAIPQVQALLLGDGAGLGEVVQKMDESFNRARASYSNRNQIESQNRRGWADQVNAQAQIEQRVTRTFGELAKRGTTAHFSALSPRVVRADGKAVRVPIATSEFSAAVRMVAVPEVSLNAVRTAEIKNTAEQAILPGKVALFADGAFVGTSEFSFVAPGETFSTFLGVFDRLKLERALDRKKSAIKRSSKRTELKVSYLVTAENLADVPVVLELGDRIPVAQLSDIEIDDVKLPEGAKRDASGVVTWTSTIAPKKKLSWRIEYTIEYPNDLFTKGKSPAMPAPQRKMMDDLESLEKML